MRKTLTTATLLLAFSYPALAGEIHTPGAPTTPPPSPGIMHNPSPTSPLEEPTDDAAVNGVMPTPGVSDMLTETALELLAVLPALL